MKYVRIILILFSTLWSQPSVLIISPEPDEEVLADNILIAASFYNLENISPDNIQLILDDKNITSSAFVDNDMISYYLSIIEPGEHKIELITGDGDPIHWTFSALGETKQKVEPLTYSGNVRTNTSIDQVDKESLSVSQLFFDFKGTAYEILKFDTKIKLTNQENSLYQPRNVFGLKINLGDVLALNLGDTNPQLSHYTLTGKRIRGLDAALTWGWFNLHVVKGEINRSVQGALENSYSYTVKDDEDGNKFLALSRQGYTFKQDVLAGRLALGRGENFQWGIHFLKARDDTLSVKHKVNDAIITYSESDGALAGLDSGNVYTISELSNPFFDSGEDWKGPTPKDNFVVGTDLTISSNSKRMVLEGEIAFSLTNNNIWGGAMSKAEMDTLLDDEIDDKLSSFELGNIPFDPIDITDLFIINENMVPLSPIDPSAFGDSSDVNIIDAIMSMPSLAYRGRAVMNYWGNYFSIEYSQVGPEFMSFGNPYLENNKRELFISDKLKLFKNRLMVNIGYKHQDDDIMTNMDNIESQKTLILGLNIIPGPGLPNANLSFKTIDRDNGVKDIIRQTESTFTDNRKNTRTNHIMVNLNHRFNWVWSHNINATLMLLDKVDNVADRINNDPQYIDPGLTSNVINVTLTTNQYNIPLKTMVSYSSNSSEFSIGPDDKVNQDFQSGNIGTEYMLSNGKYIIKAGTNFAKGSGLSDVSWIGVSGGIKINIIERLSFSTHGEFRSKFIGDETNQSFIARANLDYSF
ncbi:MAG: hypothetical protein ACE5D0_02660 [Fidelibacterota bacterium]